MHSTTITQALGAVLLSGSAALAADNDHVSIKRPFDLAPSADLSYRIEARKKGISLSGDALVSWRADAARYSVSSTARAQILGKILDNRSEGIIDAFGVAPTVFREKRFRKPESTATFDRNAKTMSFNDPGQRYRLTGGEQDRASIQWQLVAIARGAPDRFVPGSEW